MDVSTCTAFPLCRLMSISKAVSMVKRTYVAATSSVKKTRFLVVFTNYVR